ncbi:hypothetical protein EUX98_g4193 [Antrodiella citrinella]|uniref:Uncharacterized protein n=1 Tax=Antrodiella citrinella TaxID=2447956 RepID=A0A4S4MUN9_9APHY|nr:hypothetical protein EUX98_g4193 [Antrodiella citrinella]
MATIQLPERCYAMDIAFPLMVVGTAELGGERNITIYDLNNPTEKLKVMKSPLNFQTRVITCFPKGTGFCIGSVEGRVALHYIDEKSFSNNYSFRCHRKSDKAAASSPRNQTVVYAINDVNFHPVHGGTFSTCGSDGTINYWDGEARIRLKILDASASGSISSTCFNRTGTIQAYAVSYDWHKGHTGNTPGLANKIMLHMCKEEEVKRQNKT